MSYKIEGKRPELYLRTMQKKILGRKFSKHFWHLFWKLFSALPARTRKQDAFTVSKQDKIFIATGLGLEDTLKLNTYEHVP